MIGHGLKELRAKGETLINGGDVRNADARQITADDP